MKTAIQTYRTPSLPPQAWLFRLSDHAELWCGANVESSTLSFFEGAWSDSFEAFNIATCQNVFGSGGVLTDEGWLLVPPSHPLEAIYAIRLTTGQWLASNSMVFLKAQLDLIFLLSPDKLQQKFIGIFRGIDHSPCRIPTSDGDLYILHHHNALLGMDLVLRSKPVPPAFEDYSAYRRHLVDTMKNIVSNGDDPNRRQRFKLLTTISSGYDSTACAAIARAVGCTDAVTFTNARDGSSDDGTDIAKQLGLNCFSVKRPTETSDDSQELAEFLATGMQGEDYVYNALRGKLNGRLFVTGFHGDKVWDLHGTATAIFRRNDISGTALGEFRLAQGFVHLPMPFIGAQQHSSILKLAHSQEMKPFSVGGSYDRPIPRRIAEEAGVSRKLLGQSKKAISLLIFNEERRNISEQLRREISQTIDAQPFRQKLRYHATVLSFIFRYRLLSFSQRLERIPALKDFISKVALMNREWITFEHAHPFNGLAFNWALDNLQKRYHSCIINRDANG
jgi:hypothetical protein